MNLQNNTLIVTRVTTRFRDSLLEYCEHNDTDVSKMIRLGLKLLLERSDKKPTEWIIR